MRPVVGELLDCCKHAEVGQRVQDMAKRRAALTCILVVGMLCGWCSVYGDHDTVPFYEGHEGDPVSPYACTKKCCELFAATYFQLYKIPARWAGPFAHCDRV